MHDIAANTLISTRELAAQEGVSRMTITRWRRTGRLPYPVHVDPHSGACLWSSTDIAEWRAAGRPVVDPERNDEAGAKLRDKADQSADEDAVLWALLDRGRLTLDEECRIRDLLVAREKAAIELAKILNRADARANTPLDALRAERERLQEENDECQ